MTQSDTFVDEIPILKAEKLGKRFGDFRAVNGIELRVNRFQIHSVIGPNGAGKSTLFNLLAGAVKPSEGTIRFNGVDVTDKDDAQRVQLGMARSFQVTSLFAKLTVLENLRLAAQGVLPRRALRFWENIRQLEEPYEVAQELLTRLGMRRHACVAAGALAHGQQRMLEVGMCLAARPQLLLLDEPTSGMGVNDIPMMRELIQNVARDHTVVLIEHNMSIVLDISDRITVMSRGSILAEGDPEEIRNHDDVRRAYLGNGLKA